MSNHHGYHSNEGPPHVISAAELIAARQRRERYQDHPTPDLDDGGPWIVGVVVLFGVFLLGIGVGLVLAGALLR